MKQLLLSDIIKNIGAVCNAADDTVITGVSTDTRTIQKGDLFIALAGENFDGHHYVSTAEANGAAAVVCSRPVTAGVPVLMVEDTLLALQRLAAYYRTLLPIGLAAVTGSNGKTTTRDMLAAVLSAKYRVYSTKKNFNNEIGLPKSMLEIDDSYDIAVLEMGMNHFGEISRLTRIAKPDAALITNIGKAHIGNLGSQENILKAKLEVLEGLNRDGLLILNGDDALLRSADTGEFCKAFIGIDNPEAELRAENIAVRDGKTFFTVVYDGRSCSGYLPVIGRYNVLNALEAMRCGVYFGVSIEDAFRALEGYRSVGMRCEAEDINGVTVVKDYYNASPDSSRVALEALGDYTKGGRKIALLGEMLELGGFSEEEHYRLGAMCRDNGIDSAFFIGADYQAFQKGMPDASRVFPPESREALKEAVRAFVCGGNITKGDAVLVKGSRGMRMEEFYEVLSDCLKCE